MKLEHLEMDSVNMLVYLLLNFNTLLFVRFDSLQYSRENFNFKFNERNNERNKKR